MKKLPESFLGEKEKKKKKKKEKIDENQRTQGLKR